MAVAVEATLLNPIDTSTLVAAGIQVVEILNESGLRESDGQRVHGVVAMVIALGPVLDTPDRATVFVLIGLCESQPVILVPIQFLHDVYELPVFTQAVGDASDGGDDLRHQVFQYLACLLGDVLRVAKVAVNESFGDVCLAHEQLVVFCLADGALFVEVINHILVFCSSLLTPFVEDIVVGCGVALLDIDVARFQCLIGE